MSRRVLLVDDEELVTSGLRRNLRRRFDIETCNDPSDALELVSQQSEPFSVVVSDYQMPGINGIDFLARVRVIAPETVRIMLTGQADLDASMRAVNEGEVFRFLTKPCPSDTLAAALGSAIRQFELERAEHELLEQTLKGTVNTLVELVGLLDPSTYEESVRIRDVIKLVAKRMGLPDPWRFELAGVLSQLGTLTLPRTIADDHRAGLHLDPQPAALWATHPGITATLLSNIPRMELVAEMIAMQAQPPPTRPAQGWQERCEDADVVGIGAHLLDIALRARHVDPDADSREIFSVLGAESGPAFRMEAVRALTSAAPVERNRHQMTASLSDLRPGMTLLHEVTADNGIMLLKEGSSLTGTQIQRLRAFSHTVGVPDDYTVLG
jgi:DNA-binding NarL/FixJ family response regulator